MSVRRFHPTDRVDRVPAWRATPGARPRRAVRQRAASIVATALLCGLFGTTARANGLIVGPGDRIRPEQVQRTHRRAGYVPGLKTGWEKVGALIVPEPVAGPLKRAHKSSDGAVLASFDVDDTATRRGPKDATGTRALLGALAAYHEVGIPLVTAVNTGRKREETSKLLREHGFEDFPHYYITEVGTRVEDGKGRPLAHQDEVFRAHGWSAEAVGESIARAVSKARLADAIVSQGEGGQGPYKRSYFIKPEVLGVNAAAHPEQAAAAVREMVAERLAPALEAEGWTHGENMIGVLSYDNHKRWFNLDILPRNGGKGAGMMVLATALGIEPGRVIHFDDDTNGLHAAMNPGSLFGAVGNTTPSMKQAIAHNAAHAGKLPIQATRDRGQGVADILLALLPHYLQ